MNNPFIANEENVKGLFAKHFGADSDLQNLYDDFFISDQDRRDDVITWVKEMGHDGMIIPEDWDGGFGYIKSYVVFSPSQIKVINKKSEVIDLVNPEIPNSDVFPDKQTTTLKDKFKIKRKPFRNESDGYEENMLNGVGGDTRRNTSSGGMGTDSSYMQDNT